MLLIVRPFFSVSFHFNNYGHSFVGLIIIAAGVTMLLLQYYGHAYIKWATV